MRARSFAAAGYASARYGDDRWWLCRPDLPSDACRADLTATEIHPDGSRTVIPYAPAADPKVDCFYVYPTVDMGVFPGNHTDFADTGPMARTTVAQAARFGEVCRLFVPLYRQVTIGTYVFGEEQREARLAVAFSDVADAFLQYMARYNHGRKVALVGHSQGAEMVVRLVQTYFDGDPAMRERLLVAMPIGGNVEVAKGRLVGGSFQTVPMCTRPEETGCVVAFRSYRPGSGAPPSRWLPAAGRESLCVNPADPAGNAYRWFSRTYLPSGGDAARYVRGIGGVQTPWVLFRDLFAGRCVEGAGGDRHLEVWYAPAANDRRESPLDLGAAVFGTSLGLHILDFQFPQGDLIDLVARKAAAASPP
jgi:hypothetical protein